MLCQNLEAYFDTSLKVYKNLAFLDPAEPTEAPVEATEAPAEDTSVTVTDMTGREVTLEEPVTRIVALTASDCEIICALGGMDLLVGRGTYCDYPAEVQEIPSVQSGYETNIEQIIALEPQVLLMSTMAQSFIRPSLF